VWSTLRVGRAKDRNKANGLRLPAVLLMADSSPCRYPDMPRFFPRHRHGGSLTVTSVLQSHQSLQISNLASLVALQHFVQ
jgi:hypothetical protein